MLFLLALSAAVAGQADPARTSFVDALTGEPVAHMAVRISPAGLDPLGDRAARQNCFTRLAETNERGVLDSDALDRVMLHCTWTWWQIELPPGLAVSGPPRVDLHASHQVEVYPLPQTQDAGPWLGSELAGMGLKVPVIDVLQPDGSVLRFPLWLPPTVPAVPADTLVAFDLQHTALYRLVPGSGTAGPYDVSRSLVVSERVELGGGVEAGAGERRLRYFHDLDLPDGLYLCFVEGSGHGTVFAVGAVPSALARAREPVLVGPARAQPRYAVEVGLVVPKLQIDAPLYFATTDNALLPASGPTLDLLARALRKLPESAVVEISSHVESVTWEGEGGFGADSSLARAQALRDYLVADGIAAERIQASGLGATQPIDSNFSRDGRRNNRRIEVALPSWSPPGLEEPISDGGAE